MEYVAFEIGRGGPRGEKVAAHTLCAKWNERLLEDRPGVSIRAGWGSTGNYFVTCPEILSISSVSMILAGLPRARSFVLFSAMEFTARLFQFRSVYRTSRPPAISDELKRRRPDIDWRGISGFRIVAVHGDLGVDLQQVWSIVNEDVEPLENALRELLAFLDSK